MDELAILNWAMFFKIKLSINFIRMLWITIKSFYFTYNQPPEV